MTIICRVPLSVIRPMYLFTELYVVAAQEWSSYMKFGIENSRFYHTTLLARAIAEVCPSVVGCYLFVAKRLCAL